MNIRFLALLFVLSLPVRAAEITAISPDKKVVVLDFETGKIDAPQIWTLRPWRRRTIVPVDSHKLSTSPALSWSGRLVAWGCKDGTLRVFDARNGHLLARLGHAFGRGYNFPYEILGVAFSPDGRILASANAKGLFLWNWRQRKLLFSRPLGEIVVDDPNGFAFHRWPLTIRFSPDGRRVAVGGKTANDDYVHVFLFDVRRGARRHLWHIASADAGPIQLAFSPGGNRLLVVSQYFASESSDDQAHLFDTRSGRILWQKDNSALITGSSLDSTDRYPDSAAFSSDGRRVAISGLGANDGGINFLEIRRASDGKRVSLRTDQSDSPSLNIQKQLRAELAVP